MSIIFGNDSNVYELFSFIGIWYARQVLLKEAMVWLVKHWLPCDNKKANKICAATEDFKESAVLEKMNKFRLSDF